MVMKRGEHEALMVHVKCGAWATRGGTKTRNARRAGDGLTQVRDGLLGELRRG